MSSQYLTALLMAAPLATGSEGITIKIRDELVSQPYVDMTVRLMERFGVRVRSRHHLCQMLNTETLECSSDTACRPHLRALNAGRKGRSLAQAALCMGLQGGCSCDAEAKGRPDLAKWTGA